MQTANSHFSAQSKSTPRQKSRLSIFAQSYEVIKHILWKHQAEVIFFQVLCFGLALVYHSTCSVCCIRTGTLAQPDPDQTQSSFGALKGARPLCPSLHPLSPAGQSSLSLLQPALPRRSSSAQSLLSLSGMHSEGFYSRCIHILTGLTSQLFMY